MKDGELVVGIFMHPDLGFDVMTAMAISRDLQELGLVSDTVIGPYLRCSINSKVG